MTNLPTETTRRAFMQNDELLGKGELQFVTECLIVFRLLLHGESLLATSFLSRISNLPISQTSQRGVSLHLQHKWLQLTRWDRERERVRGLPGDAPGSRSQPLAWFSLESMEARALFMASVSLWRKALCYFLCKNHDTKEDREVTMLTFTLAPRALTIFSSHQNA